jgi:hypothetical protein
MVRPRPATQRVARTDEEDSMTDTSRRISARLRRGLRRLDDWTLTAFNPRYPTPGQRD